MPIQCPYDGMARCFLLSRGAARPTPHVVVVNHALLLSDMAAGGGKVPAGPTSYLVVDEAHRLEDQATAQLGYFASTGGIGRSRSTGSTAAPTARRATRSGLRGRCVSTRAGGRRTRRPERSCRRAAPHALEAVNAWAGGATSSPRCGAFMRAAHGRARATSTAAEASPGRCARGRTGPTVERGGSSVGRRSPTVAASIEGLSGDGRAADRQAGRDYETGTALVDGATSSTASYGCAWARSSDIGRTEGDVLDARAAGRPAGALHAAPLRVPKLAEGGGCTTSKGRAVLTAATLTTDEAVSPTSSERLGLDGRARVENSARRSTIAGRR